MFRFNKLFSVLFLVASIARSRLPSSNSAANALRKRNKNARCLSTAQERIVRLALQSKTTSAKDENRRAAMCGCLDIKPSAGRPLEHTQQQRWCTISHRISHRTSLTVHLPPYTPRARRS